ncbi:MAG: hypothetical protein AAFR33_10635 [Pseudomonadota bacterium]
MPNFFRIDTAVSAARTAAIAIYVLVQTGGIWIPLLDHTETGTHSGRSAPWASWNKEFHRFEQCEV